MYLAKDIHKRAINVIRVNNVNVYVLNKNMTKTLLDQAKKIKSNGNKRRFYDEQDIDLCLAWAKNEITLNQIAQVKNMPNKSSFYCYFSNTIKIAYQKGKIIIK